MTVYIVRHGQTAMNRNMALQGRSDIPLNETGREQARLAARVFQSQGVVFDRVYSSPLTRAMETAKLIAPGHTPIPDERLIEMDYGPYEGMDLRTPAPEMRIFFQDFVRNPAPEGVEPLARVVARLGGFLEELRAEAGNLLISTHAIAMKGALEYLTPDSHGAYWSKNIGNCAIYRTELLDGAYTIPSEWPDHSLPSGEAPQLTDKKG